MALLSPVAREVIMNIVLLHNEDDDCQQPIIITMAMEHRTGMWGPVVQWLVQRFRSERLRVRF